MKRAWIVSLLIVAVLLVVTVAVQAQELESWKFDSISVSGGEDAISSGITASASLVSKKNNFSIAIGQEQACLTLGHRFYLIRGINFDLVGSIGHF